MKVCLVNPPRFNGLSVVREDRCENVDADLVHPPTSLVYIAGVLRAEGFDVSLMDANADNSAWSFVEAKLRSLRPDWVIYRAAPSTFYEDVKVSKICKRLGIRTLLLCWNLRSEKERVLKECPELDVYLNEYHYEYLIPSILDGRSNAHGTKTTDVPFPSWDLVPDFKKFYTRTPLFSPWAVIRGSKGCPYQCNFCHPSETMITLPNGTKIPIQDIGIGDYAKGQKLLYNTVVKTFKRKVNNLITIETEDGHFLQNTEEDPIFTRRGWILAKDLKDADEVLVE
jgi:hypothetical protein